MALPLAAADEVKFDPSITLAEFHQFSMVLGQAIYATPVEPARATGVLRFDVGVAASFLKVDTTSAYWRHAVSGTLTRNGYAAIPRLVVTKGLGKAMISASYAKFEKGGISTYGAALDVPIIDGGLIAPTLAVRGTYADLRGVKELSMKTYGAELFLSKGFGPFTPYAAVGRARTDSAATISRGIPVVGLPVTFRLADKGDTNRYTVGLRISLLVPKLVIEATQAEQRSYAAKISFGF